MLNAEDGNEIWYQIMLELSIVKEIIGKTEKGE